MTTMTEKLKTAGQDSIEKPQDTQKTWMTITRRFFRRVIKT